ncbi:unnamed protein product, partial [Protopolystoma xenopodis]
MLPWQLGLSGVGSDMVVRVGPRSSLSLPRAWIFCLLVGIWWIGSATVTSGSLFYRQVRHVQGDHRLGRLQEAEEMDTSSILKPRSRRQNMWYEGATGLAPDVAQGPQTPTGRGDSGGVSFFTRLAPTNRSVKDRILNRSFAGYKIYERPTEGQNRPTVVIIHIKILAITSVDVIKMEYTVDMYLRQQWIDERLAWDHSEEFEKHNSSILLTLRRGELWLPDLFFRNGKQGFMYEMTTPNCLVRVEPNGQIMFSQKITMRLGCQMNLLHFPMDKQMCYINMGSYGYTDDYL